MNAGSLKGAGACLSCWKAFCTKGMLDQSLCENDNNYFIKLCMWWRCRIRERKSHAQNTQWLLMIRRPTVILPDITLLYVITCHSEPSSTHQSDLRILSLTLSQTSNQSILSFRGAVLSCINSYGSHAGYSSLHLTHNLLSSVRWPALL